MIFISCSKDNGATSKNKNNNPNLSFAEEFETSGGLSEQGSSKKVVLEVRKGNYWQGENFEFKLD